MHRRLALFLVVCFAASLLPALAMPITQVASGPLTDGRLQIFALDGQGGLWSVWQLSTDPAAAWSQWSSVPTPGIALSQISMSKLADGRLLLWAVDAQGGLWSMWKQTTDPNAGWTKWQAFQVPGAASSSRGYTTTNVMNPQALNPQPLPPGLKQQSLVKNLNPLALNPQPLPPG